MGKLTETVATNIRLMRHARQWTQEDLADRAGLSARYIGHLERHGASPSIDVLECIADALGVSPPELLQSARQKRNR
jgi:transcriptional regulator with XRE-family HTH domain